MSPVKQLHTYQIECEECMERVTVRDVEDEYDAASAAEKQGWLVRAYTGDELVFCPQHFAERIPLWRKAGYEPHWLKYHPVMAAVGGKQP